MHVQGNNLQRLSHFKSFEDFRKEGLLVYSLAPVYSYSGVQQALPDAFMEESIPRRPREVRMGRLLLNAPIVTHCQELGLYLEIMDKESFLFFKHWLLSQEFISRVKKTYFEVRHWLGRCLDPVLIATSGERKPESLELFTLSGMKGMMRPSRPVAKIDSSKDPDGFVMLEVVPPEEGVLERGRAAFQILKDGL